MKTILISSFHTLISRNILQTAVLPFLLENGIRIVLVVPEKKVSYFKQTFGGDRIFVEGITIPEKPLENFFQIFSYGLVGVENHVVRGWKTGKKLQYYTAHIFYALFSKLFFLHKAYRFITRHYLRTNVFDHLFSQYAPDLVVATDSFDKADRLLLLEAKRKHIKTLGMIRSWDNTTTKGVFIPNPDHFVVTNKVVGEELSSIHHVPAHKITVIGVPHYDKVNERRQISRENLFREVGLDPKKKTIFFSPGGKMLYKHDDEVLALFKKLLDEKRFDMPVQFLVSIQPGDTIDTSGIENDERFIVYRFGTNITGRRKENEFAPDENERLNDFLYYCDMLVTLVSTMAIDGTVFNKPVIVFAFDPRPSLPDKMAKFAKYKHFEKFLGTGLVTTSYSEEEFVDQINNFLKNPNINKKEREELISLYTHKSDGRSSERFAQAILSML